jgi:uncharacterized protein YjiS (DUF1127 family)
LLAAYHESIFISNGTPLKENVMAIGHATVNLGFHTARRERKSTLLQLLLSYEAWLDERRSSKALYQMDDRALADIGLSRADVEGLNAESWQDHLPPAFSR